MKSKCLANAIKIAILIIVTCIDLHAQLVINEIHNRLASVESGVGDVNLDGSRNPFEDKFIELVNLTNTNLDISGWVITVGELNPGTIAHQFANTVVPGNGRVIVFRGGNLNAFNGGNNLNVFGDNTIVQVSNTGIDLLKILDGSETVRIFNTSEIDGNSVPVDAVTYFSESSDAGVSIGRVPDATGSFSLDADGRARANHPEFDDGRAYSAGLGFNLEQYLNGLVKTIPAAGGDNYTLPITDELVEWDSILDNILAGNIENANSNANNLNYRVFIYQDNSIGGDNLRDLILLEEKLPKLKHWGTFVFDNTPDERIIIQAPHSRADFNTGFQAIYCFLRLKGQALFLNGTHRCNDTDLNHPDTCDGTTKLCSGDNTDEPFRISDLAHNEVSVFHRATIKLANAFPSSKFIQLHGFAKEEDDPYVILSNGTNDDVNIPDPDYTNDLKDALQVQDNSLTFEIGHENNWTKLIARTNTQGRYLNSSDNVCFQNASAASGRFLHIEQELTKLRQDQVGWEKMRKALEMVFFPMSLPVELLYFKAKVDGKIVALQWETIQEKNNDYFSVERSIDGTSFKPITNMKGAGDSQNSRRYSFVDENPYSGISYYRLKQTDIDGKYSYSEVVKVKLDSNFDFRIYPNPYNNRTQLTIEQAVDSYEEKKLLSIRDIFGREIYRKEIEMNPVTTLDLNLPKGTYFISIFNSVKSKTRKLLVF